MTKKKNDPAIDFEQFETSGFEHVSTEDLGIPFIGIVQKGSAEFDKTHKDYETKKIEGCQPGDIVHSTKKRILWTEGDAPLPFVPCGYEKLWVEWKTRGGFVKHHASPLILNETKRNDANKDELSNGNIIVTTAYFYGLLVAEDFEHEKVVIAMTATQLKKARQWLNAATALRLTRKDGTQFTPPIFSHIYPLTTCTEHNDQGSWFGWKINMPEIVSDTELLNECSTVANSIRAGSHRRLLGAPPAEGATGSDDVPF